MSRRRGLTIVYTGDGKGKTTAAGEAAHRKRGHCSPNMPGESISGEQ